MELISRERLIDEVVAIAKTSESDWRGVKFSAREIKFFIELQKTVESRPKGKWQKDIGCFECSNCGWIITAGEEEINNYCPHCGADMRGEE